MSKYGPILIVEDDQDDQQMYRDIITALQTKNPVIFFEEGVKLISFLLSTAERPFLIICDVNLPGMTGIELRKQIFGNEFLRKKSIPFVFLSTSSNATVVDAAYDLTVQGFFEKKTTWQEIKDQLQLILSYWTNCNHPSNY